MLSGEIRIFQASWPDARERFMVTTSFPDDQQDAGDEYAVQIHPDEPIWRATEVLWMDYCIRHGISRHTPYRVTLSESGAPVDIEQTPHESRFWPEEARQPGSRIVVEIQVRFERLTSSAQ